MTTSGMDEVFGNFPNRPNTREFWKLSEVVLQLDGAAEAGESFDSLVQKVVDVDSLLYMAQQRVRGAIGPGSGVDYEALVMKMTSIYLDGFMAGAGYAKLTEIDTGGDST